MATIKEMAHNHVAAYMHNDDYEEMADTFEAGANAVLETIEKAVSYERYKEESEKGETPPYSEFVEGELNKIIKELKGEEG